MKPKRWTESDNKKLIKLWVSGMKVENIRLAMDRSEKSIYKQLKIIDAPSRKPYRPPSIPKPKPVKKEPVVIVFDGVIFSERTGCCFPVNNQRPFHYCNRQIETKGDGKSWQYCDAHKKIMHERGKK